MRKCPACARAFPGDGWACPHCAFEPPLRDGWREVLPPDREKTEGYASEHFGTLEASEDGSFWFRARNALVLRALGRYFPGAGAYLEAGCGTGYVLSAVERAFPGWRTVGLEFFPEGLRVAARRVVRSELVRADLLDPPWEGEFDVVGAYDVLEHLEDDGKALAALHRVLRPGGGLVATVPQHPGLWSATDDAARHVRRYRRGELERKLREAGFQVAYSTSFMALLLPLLIGSRKGRRSGEAKLELNLPPWIDRTLGAVLWVERALLRAGLRIPVGGSRLVVALKTGAPADSRPGAPTSAGTSGMMGADT